MKDMFAQTFLLLSSFLSSRDAQAPLQATYSWVEDTGIRRTLDVAVESNPEGGSISMTLNSVWNGASNTCSTTEKLHYGSPIEHVQFNLFKAAGAGECRYARLTFTRPNWMETRVYSFPDAVNTAVVFSYRTPSSLRFIAEDGTVSKIVFYDFFAPKSEKFAAKETRGKRYSLKEEYAIDKREGVWRLRSRNWVLG